MADAFLPLRQIERALRTSTAYILIGVLLLGSVISFPSPFPGIIKPFLILMPIYYWAIYRPTLVPPAFCFFTGLLTDVLAGGPLGLSAFVLVTVQWVARRQRRFLMGQPYVTIWAVFIVMNIAGSAVQYLLLGLVEGEWPPLMSVILSATAGIFIFPFVTLILVANHKLLPVASRSRH